MSLTPDQAAFLVRRRVGRLATAGASGEPHAVPVCFAYDGAGSVYVPLDEKPKSVPATRLKRVRNILENPRAALLVDRYAEDWSRLAFVMARGRAELVEPGLGEHAAAVRLLRGKYHQYERMRLEEQPVIALRVERAAAWGALDAAPEESSFLDTARGRRSVRRYLEKEVPEELVERVLEAARWAPSPHGAQPWRFAVIRRPGTKERLAEAMGAEWRRNLEMDGQEPEVVGRRLEGSRRRLLEAPVLVLLCLYPGELDRYPDEARQRNEIAMAIQSLGAAAQNALLAAYSLGLDGGWMCAPLFCPEAVVEALGLGRDLVPHALLTLGYAAGDPPKRRSRRPLEELVVFRDA
ncbi:TIGR03668 family PPOX class F420-dependent oxidoreductase [Rubrobacter taiwanensis]|uniref:TIGR03668 family PPOX class F420-dependent oxidoreductase n=1 Tax=Rubrobacter taiwanensis TaxID=185139 RepID=A0A4R1B8E2_9ACTN|nr:TIGR03668 family PPOX class F420-dependent oxidoreductase [Rubrobacter taiwanensis]TCJ12209.1 TIGR03668 family PPOX class F420-dependent oxidoreductase [Rubrobacter taiwanensis]